MAEDPSFLSTKRYAVVTGANRGIGFEICKQLASKGVVVVLTARDEKRGLQAVEQLKGLGCSGDVFFHQLDVSDPKAIASLVEFVKTKFGKLDILVNNAGVVGIKFDHDAVDSEVASGKGFQQINWLEITSQTHEITEEAVKINYYGTKLTTEALIPLLQLSDSARIVNVSSSMGQLENLPNECAKRVLSNTENLNEDKIDLVLNEFLKDSKDGSVAENSWPPHFSAYIISKASMNAYGRVMARKYPSMHINSVCPGNVKTDMNFNTGKLPVEDGAASPVKLALMPNGGPSGLFFIRQEVAPF